MDLGAFMYLEYKIVRKYVDETFGHVPHNRGVRFMAFEKPVTCRNCGYQSEMWEKFCGQDVIYFHLQDNGDGKIDSFLETHKSELLGSCDDFTDPGYKDYYFTATINSLYKVILERMERNEL